MTALDFADPTRVHLLWLVVAMTAALLWLDARGSQSLQRLVAPSLLARLVTRPSTTRRRLRIALLAATGVFLTLALMRPQWGLRMVHTPQVGAEIMIALDVSKSMLAEDVAPNRLERAKADIRDLLEYLKGDQVGLIVFAGRATVVAPLTPDFSFLRMVLDSAGPHSVTRGGTRLEEPIRKAVDGFAKEGSASRSILLITDGEDQDSFPKEAAKAAAERGVKILAIGFGNEAGSEIVLTDPVTGVRSPMRNADGDPVKSRLDGAMLRELALITDGAYVPAGTGLLDLKAIYQQHISGLTRGRMDGTTRQIRNEAFQWPLLLALATLVLAAGTTALPNKKKRGAGSILGALLIAALASPVSMPRTAAAQQQPALPPAASAAGPAAQLEPSAEANREASDEQNDGNDDEAAPQEPELQLRPDDAREAYNLALRRMNEGKLDRAAELYEHTREVAGTDVEVRSRATFNRAWIEIVRADASLQEQELEEALTSLRGAADWFRRALSLRPGDDEARSNLEITLGRIQALEDQLANADETPLLDRIVALLERQRDFSMTLAETMEAAAGDDSPSAIEALRPRFRMLASDELDILSEAHETAEFGQREADALAARDREELEPSEAARSIQLEGALQLLHQARERLGQTRSRLRILEAEPAWRRSVAAIDVLKRARDQLLDPVTILDGLVSDSSELMGLTGALQALRSDSYEGPERPWLSAKFLNENATALSERTQALSAGFKAAVEQVAEQDAAGAPSEPRSPEETAFFEAMNDSTALLDDAVGSLQRAASAAEGERLDAATAAEAEAVASLVDARERFLDLRRLIDLAVQEAQAARGLLEAKADPAQLEAAGEDVDAIVAAADKQASEFTKRNLERSERIAASLEREAANAAAAAQQQDLAADPAAADAEKQRFELAKGYLAQARVMLENTAQALENPEAVTQPPAQPEPELESLPYSQDPQDPQDSQSPPERALQPPPTAPANTALVQAQHAEDSLRDLQRLFFNVVEHLQDLLRRQVDLGDESEQAAAAMRAHPDQDHTITTGPLAARQSTHSETAEAIATALREQGEQLRNTPAEQAPQEGPSPAEQAERVELAAAHVDNARGAMETATADLASSPAPMADVRLSQIQAVDELSAALAALQPPEDQPQDQPEEQDQEEEQDEQQDQQDGEQEEQQQNQPSPGEGEQEEEQQPPVDPTQALQGIRDREAERRAEQERSEPGRYEPVERDW